MRRPLPWRDGTPRAAATIGRGARNALRSCLILLGLVAAAPAALAAASTTPTNYTPDPALRRAAPAELEARIRRACTVTQARQQNVSETSLGRPCACYARQTIRSLSPAEIQAYRDTGVFNDTARAKAVAALQGCGLPAPR